MKGRGLVESFLVKLTLLLKGTAMAAPEKFGETLTDEQQRGGKRKDPLNPDLKVGFDNG